MPDSENRNECLRKHNEWQVWAGANPREAVLDYWRFTTFILRFCFSYEKQHSVWLFTGTAFRSLSFSPALPKSAELAKAILPTVAQIKIPIGKTYRYFNRERRGSCIGLLTVQPFAFVKFCLRKKSLITTVSQGRVSFALFIAYTTGKGLLICPSDRLLFSQTFYRFNLPLASLLSKSSTRKKRFSPLLFSH